ncbi:hypothetical protein R2K36_34280, partial [Pseudomonas aeruginosa]
LGAAGGQVIGNKIGGSTGGLIGAALGGGGGGALGNHYADSNRHDDDDDYRGYRRARYDDRHHWHDRGRHRGWYKHHR